MLYYSVLKDIIRQPRTNEDLMNSILQKAASIVREYGIDYVMEHNKDHYFDYDKIVDKWFSKYKKEVTD